MVMADRNNDDFRNGRRSRGASPQSDSGSNGDDSEQEALMRVGDEYQATIPDYTPDVKMDGRPEAMLVWAPKDDLSECTIDEYIQIAKEKHGYNTEQALGMLFWHKHNVEKALSDLPNFTPFPDDWSVEDKVLFEQAFGFHGKSFHRIRQMLPDKPIASLVKFYYAWKKTRSRTSLMDRQAKKLAIHREDSKAFLVPSRLAVRKHGSDSCDDGSEDGSGHSDVENHSKENGKEDKNACCNCPLRSSQLHQTPKGPLCSTCYQHWRKTGCLRPAGQRRHESQHTGRPTPFKHKRKPPRGMYLNKDDLLAMVSGPSGQDEAILRGLDSDLVSLKRNVQNNKQMLSLQKHKLAGGISQFLPNTGPQRLANKWTNEELLLAVQGVRKYGKHYKAIAEVIGNKTENHVRGFFQTFRRRYNLDEVLAEYEAEHGSESIREEEEELVEQMEVDSKPDSAVAPLVPHSNGAPSSSEPPPLLKQPTPSGSKGQHTRLLPPSKTVLAQPPPLIRPSASPAASSSSQPGGSTPQPAE